MNYNYTYQRIIKGDASVGRFSGGAFYGGHVSPEYLGNVIFTPDEFGNNQNLIQKVGIRATSEANECTGVPKSGRALSYDDILDIPEGSGAADAVELFAVRYPYYIDGVYHSHLMVCKGYRSGEYANRYIGSTGKAGTYVTVTLLYYTRVGIEGGQTQDIQLASSQSDVYKPNTNDVTESVTHLEFFYATQTPAVWDDHIDQVFIGISNRFMTTGGGFKCCQYELWAPRMRGTVACYTAYFGEFVPESIEYSDDYGFESSTGGYGDDGATHDLSSDDIEHSSLPTLSVLSPGFVNVYKVTSGLLGNLGKALFPEPIFDADFNIIQAMNQLSVMLWNGKLIDYIIDCHIIPVDVPAGSSAHITCGGKELRNPDTQNAYSAPRVSASYVTKSCGSLTIGECFGNFLDYTVRCKLYLPFYGYVDIPAEYWNGGTLSVEYAFNIIDGTFVAYVKGKAKHSQLNSLIGQYSGVAVTHIPVRGQDYSQVVSGLIMTGVGVASTAATGGAASVLTGGTMASGLGQMLSSKPGLQTNGSSNSSSAMMMHKKPYLIIEYPTPQFSSRYPKESGLPLNVANALGFYGGMTIAENPVLDGIPCTEREKERIRAALKTGLIFR